MLKSIIIEDQAPAQYILEKYILNSDLVTLEKTFSNVVEAGIFLEKNSVDLVFLDINLPLISGMDFLRTAVAQPITILTTAYSEFALESYQYNVVDYLLKPFSYERFSQAIDKVVTLTGTQLPSEGHDSALGKDIYFRCSHDLMKVNSDEIIFITSDSDYTKVITTTHKYLTLDTLKEWASKLDHDFVQTHKSFIINIKHVLKISKNKVHLNKGQIIPIGRVFKKRLMEVLEGHH